MPSGAVSSAYARTLLPFVVVAASASHGSLVEIGPFCSTTSLAVSESDVLLAAEQVRAMRDPEIVPGSFGFREKRG